jgi:hypothetical protein
MTPKVIEGLEPKKKDFSSRPKNKGAPFFKRKSSFRNSSFRGKAGPRGKKAPRN